MTIFMVELEIDCRMVSKSPNRENVFADHFLDESRFCRFDMMSFVIV